MKRKSENLSNTTSSSKRPRLIIPSLPHDLWRTIFNQADFNTRNNLRLTSCFFSRDQNIVSSHLKELLARHIFDYSSDDELLNHLTLPVTIEKCQVLVGLFQNNNYLSMLARGLSKNIDIQLSIFKLAINTVKQGNLVCFNYLIARFLKNLQKCLMEIDDKNMTLTGYAAQHGRKSIFFKLLNVAIEENLHPFHIDEIEPDSDAHLLLADIGWDFLVPVTPVHLVALRSDKEWLALLFSNYSREVNTVFGKGYLLALESLVEGDYPLFCHLIETDNELLNEQDTAGWTLLHWTCVFPDRHQFLDYVLSLNLEIRYKCLTPVFLACATNNVYALRCLKEAGFSIEKYFNNVTCLHLAAYHGHIECLRYLAEECKQDINQKSFCGDTPLSLTLIADNDGVKFSPVQLVKKHDCEKLLIKAGAEKHDLAVTEKLFPA